jgi:hypothetical protein
MKVVVIAVGLTLVVLLSGACSTDHDGAPDAASRVDVHAPTEHDLLPQKRDTPAWMVVDERPRTWNRDIQPILIEHCGPCHVGPDLTSCIGGSCMSMFYEAYAEWWTCCGAPYGVYAERPVCLSGAEPVHIYECGMKRVYSFESQGKDPVPPEQVLILEQWIEDGLLE